jgi:hypothetical protein
MESANPDGIKTKPTCRLCGESITAQSEYRDPCLKCLKNEPETLLKRFDEADRNSLKQELNIDPNLKEHIYLKDVSKSFGDKWLGYKLELFGVEIGKFSDFDWETYENKLRHLEKISPQTEKFTNFLINLKNTPNKLMPFPCIKIVENPDLIVMLCRMRVFFEGDSFYSEMKVHSFGARRVSIQGLERSKTKTDLERAWKGLELLRKIDKNFGGRPKGTTKMSHQEFRNKAVRIYAEYFEEFNEAPRAEYIAEELKISVPTFNRRMREISWKMATLRTHAIKKIKGNSVFDNY